MTKNNTSLKKEKLEKSALIGMAWCYSYENTRTTENGTIVKEGTTKGMQHDGENKLYAIK
jgi:hypothetical protein